MKSQKIGLALLSTALLASPAWAGDNSGNNQAESSAQAEASPDSLNKLTPAEQQEGWQLLFDGKDFNGWHNFRKKDIRPGWQVKDGDLVCVDPHNAGDLCTAKKYGAFVLELEFKMAPGANSGIMYHVTEHGRAAWMTGPEVQLEDNKLAGDPQRCGWLYGLYKPATDPNTGKPIDSTKPAGEWNKIRIVISPEKCEHYVNGVKYVEYVLGSDDFKDRVAKSKFAEMPNFAKADSGFIVLQGDHGQVSFRNIKLKPLPEKK